MLWVYTDDLNQKKMNAALVHSASNLCTEFKVADFIVGRTEPVTHTSQRHKLRARATTVLSTPKSICKIQPVSKYYLFDFMDSGNQLFHRNAASNNFQRDSIVSYKKTGWDAHYGICTATVKGNE